MIIPLGGGGSKIVASIIVSYPAGSTCTCALGSKVLTAKDTSGKWVFGLPSTGTWVVASASGDKTASKTVSITTEGQVETIRLAYELVLFDGANGGDNTTLTGGWSYAGHSWSDGGSFKCDTELGIAWNSTMSYGSNAKSWETWTKNTIDFSGFTTLKANITRVQTGGSAGLGIEVSDSLVAKTDISSPGIVSVSIDAISSGQPELYFTQPGGYAVVNSYIYADKVWLE